ncbi:hypothetical protein EB796_004229 [Bugula neritina]|uniref:Uncharacterized protein n=1 Tax=Bugula neritina TaxID=10212 RepID=A0A7J7KFM2_BUGNE|nr:hypothetical protein EB796_004229 [Bugula neritina]
MPTVSYLFSKSTQLLYNTCIVHSVHISITHKPEDSQCQEATGVCCLQLVTSSEVLLEQCQLCSSMCDDIGSEHLADTVQRMSQLSNKISRLIIQFIIQFNGTAE